MAFKTFNNSDENTGIKRYTGIAPAKVLAVCPSKSELEAILGTTLQNDITYIGETKLTTSTGEKTVPQVRIDFVLQSETPDGNTFITKCPFFITASARYNRDGSKLQIGDKYGRTAWATLEEYKAHKIPVYANGSAANIDADYHALRIGEESLTNFIRALLALNEPEFFNTHTGKYEKRTGEDLIRCEGSLEDVSKFLSGDFTELKNIVAMAQNNTVKVLYGVRTAPDNRLYQVVFGDFFAKNRATIERCIPWFTKALQDRKDAGAYSSSSFEIGPLQVYTVTPTDFSKPVTAAAPVDDLPMGDPFADL